MSILTVLSLPACAAEYKLSAGHDAGASEFIVYEYQGGSIVVEQNGATIYSGNFSGSGSVNYSNLKTEKIMQPPTDFKLETDLRGVKSYADLGSIRDRGRIHLNLHPDTYNSFYDLDEYTNKLDGTIEQGRRWKDLTVKPGYTTALGFVCGAPGTWMFAERDEEVVTTWMRLTATGKDVNDEVNTFRVTCSYKWQRKPPARVIKITPEVLNLSGSVGEAVKGNFDVELADLPFQNLPTPYITWNRVRASQCDLRVWNKYNDPWDEGRWVHTSYNNLIKMYVSLKSNTPQVCTEMLNMTVQIR
ncbi:hypothetical protein FK765_22805 [Escherichia coli]|nr:hypothetical protein [Escherichia coli]